MASTIRSILIQNEIDHTMASVLQVQHIAQHLVLITHGYQYKLLYIFYVMFGVPSHQTLLNHH